MSLEQDYTTVPGQLYACLSVVGPEAPQKNDKFGIKIRGAFNTRDEAASHAKRLQKEDATFDIYVVDMYKWLLIPPDPTQIEDVHYTDEKLEELITGYKENQAQAAAMFSQRKTDMMSVKAPGTDTYFKGGDENSKFYTKPEESPVSHPGEVLERLQKEKPDADMEDLVKEADEIVATEMETIRVKREAELKEKIEKEEMEMEEESKKVVVENSTEGQVKETEDDGEEEVTSDDKENKQV